MNAILDWIGAYDWHLARLNAVVLEQSAPCRLSKVSRDVAMAENVAALLELEGPTSKAVLWAHNGHAVRQSPYLISDKAAPNMGSHLDELFGHQHRVQSRIVSGARAGAGSRCPHGWAGSGRQPRSNPRRGRHGNVSHRLDCHSRRWTSRPMAGGKPPTRWIGAVYSEARAQEHLHAADPRRESDILDFLECTTAARPTRSGRRPLWSSPELAASPTNLQLSGAGELPDFWTSSSSWRMHGHEVALSNARSPGGGRTLRISRTAAPWRWGEGWLTQAFAAEPWRRKRLRLSGAVRTEVHAAGAGGQLYVEVRPEPPAGAIWRLPATHVAMIARPVRSDQWETYQVEVDVPREAHSISIGCALAGNGTAWFGDLEVAES